MQNLIFLQVVPHDLYFQWQIEVQIVNFRKFNISHLMQICVWYPNGSTQLHNWEKIQNKYPEVKIFMYKDDGVDLKLYIPTLRPHTLKKHFLQFSESLKNFVFFYHDSDIIFNYLPDFEKLIKDNIFWQSDCSSYLDYNYLSTKEKQGNIKNEEGIKLLAEIGEINPDIIKSYTNNTGGAQVLLKNIDYKFWEDVEKMCVEIRTKFLYDIPGSINKKYFNSEASGFQSWCADMWALNFAIWKRNKISKVTSDLDFSWATDTMETYLKKPIFHNAGALPLNTQGIFYKGDWIFKSPLYKNLKLPAKNLASREYVIAINNVKDDK